MARNRNVEWVLPEGVPRSGGGNSHSFDSIHAALLMDIRDELKTLNRLLSCPNFTGIPYTLDRIRRNTTKPKRAGRPKLVRRKTA